MKWEVKHGVVAEEHDEFIRRELVPLIAYVHAHTETPDEGVNLLIAALGWVLADLADDKPELKTGVAEVSKGVAQWAASLFDQWLH